MTERQRHCDECAGNYLLENEYNPGVVCLKRTSLPASVLALQLMSF